MVKSILLNTGEAFLVDDEDYPLVSRYSWRKSNYKGYAMTTFKFTDESEHTVYLHKLIMGQGCFGVCDHKDGNVQDCRKENLRLATYQQNNIAKPKAPLKNGKPTASKYKGVQPSGKKWRALIGYNRKVIQLGSHPTEEDAARAYNAKARELFGDFAWLNPVPDASQATKLSNGAV